MSAETPSLLTHFGRIVVFSIPTVVTFFSICHSPELSAKLVGTAIQDFITNIIIGIVWSCREIQYDGWFKIFLSETPIKKDFQNSVKTSLGGPPVVKFVEYKTPSAFNSPSNSSQNSRVMSPIIFKYDTWQDLTPLPEVKYSENLRVTTATNCCFTDAAKQKILQEQEEIRKRLKPHRNITTTVTCPDCTDYFVANTSRGSQTLLRCLTSKLALYTYYAMVLIGYRLWFEFLYFKVAKEVKINLYKCIGVEGDDLRAKRGEIDRVAQENFDMYIRAVDKEGTIAHS